MTQHEMLNLALYGARKRIADAAYDYYRFGGMDDRMLKRLNDSLKDHEEVEEMIKRETYSSAPTPECITVATMIDGEQIETITTPDSDA